MQEMAQLLPFSYEICSYRHRSFESRRMGVLYKPQADDETGGASAAVVQARSPSDSYLEMHYPFSSNPLLRDQYERFESGHIRLGLILEDLDTFAGDVAARHAGPPGPPRGYVTGSVDSISWFNSTGGCSSSGGSSISSGGGSNNTNSSCSSSNSSSSSSSSITWSSAHAARRPGGALALDEDLKVAGQVVWVGSSSMEVQIELSALSKASKQWMYVGMARFIMVARDVAAGVSVAVPALTADSEQERLMQALGLERQAERKALREQPGGPLQLATPTQAEVAMLYDLLARHTGNKTEQQKEQQRQEGGMLADGAQQPQQQQDQEEEEGLVRKPRAVPLSHTRLLTASLMHRQDRNTSFRIFGGHLLREAFEAAFVAAALHAGSADVEALSMADVSFQHPVPIGAILQFEAQVVYTDGPLMRIAVRALKRDPGDPTSRLITNDFSFAFVNNSRRPVVPVYPESLDEAAAYLVGYRRHIEEGFAAPEAPNHAPARVINSRA